MVGGSWLGMGFGGGEEGVMEGVVWAVKGDWVGVTVGEEGLLGLVLFNSFAEEKRGGASEEIKR